MKKWIGLAIILIDIILFIAYYTYAHYKGWYKGDFLELLFDTWNFIELSFVLLLLGLVLFLEL